MTEEKLQIFDNSCFFSLLDLHSIVPQLQASTDHLSQSTSPSPSTQATLTNSLSSTSQSSSNLQPQQFVNDIPWDLVRVNLDFAIKQLDAMKRQGNYDSTKIQAVISALKTLNSVLFS
jgi:BRCT domain type II-containing protein